MSGGRISTRVWVVAVALVPVALFASASHADPRCWQVEGRYDEREVTTDCQSSVGLCFAGDFRGDIKGPFAGTVTNLIPSADTPATGVVFFTADSAIAGKVGGRTGTLTVKNAGALRTTGEGSIADVQTIVGGTGGLTGATGELRAHGTFVGGAGSSQYEGTVCVP